MCFALKGDSQYLQLNAGCGVFSSYYCTGTSYKNVVNGKLICVQSSVRVLMSVNAYKQGPCTLLFGRVFCGLKTFCCYDLPFPYMVVSYTSYSFMLLYAPVIKVETISNLPVAMLDLPARDQRKHLICRHNVDFALCQTEKPNQCMYMFMSIFEIAGCHVLNSYCLYHIYLCREKYFFMRQRYIYHSL